MSDELLTILGVSASASVEEIHAAFRKLARQHHPDLGGDRKKFQKLNAAYEDLLRQKEAERSAQLKQPSKTGEAFSPDQTPNPAPYHSPPPPKQTKKQQESAAKSKSQADEFRHLLTGKLPLQNQTTYFILVNALDIFLTYLHLTRGNVEANPIAAFFISKWNVPGMIAFKMIIVASVCVIAQIIALKSLQKGSWLLNFGTAFIACVVLYSVWLLTK